jgi:ankyrin repeat protein
MPTALLDALRRNDLAEADRLSTERARIDEADALGITPLMLLARRGDLARVHALLERGADPNLANVLGWTALLEAASLGRTEIITALLERGATLDSSAIDGCTALQLAVAAEADDAVELLLKRGALERERSSLAPGWGAVQRAADRANSRLIERLRVAGGKFGAAEATLFLRRRLLRNLHKVTPSVESGSQWTQTGDEESWPDEVTVDQPFYLPVDMPEVLTRFCSAHAGDGPFSELMIGDVLKLVVGGVPEKPVEKPRSVQTFDWERDAFSEIVAPLLHGAAEIPTDPEPRAQALGRALYRAASEGRAALIGPLLRGGADAQLIHTGYGMTAFEAAAKAGHRNVLEAFLGESDALRPTQQQLDLALRRATANGRLELLPFLRERGANPFEVPKLTNLLHEAIDSQRIEVVELVLSWGVSTEESDPQGRTPLMEAARLKNSDLLVALLRGGANVNARSKPDQLWSTERRKDATALHFAADAGQLTSVMRLLDAGAEPNARDELGRTALHWAALSVFTKEAALFHQLVKGGVDINAQDNEGVTALMLVVERPRVELVPSLLLAGARTDLRDCKGRTVVHAATRYSGIQVMLEQLRAAGADLDALDNEGNTALHTCVDNYQFAAGDLLRAGARWDVKDARGTTVLELARVRNRPIVLAALKAAGAPV